MDISHHDIITSRNGLRIITPARRAASIPLFCSVLICVVIALAAKAYAKAPYRIGEIAFTPCVIDLSDPIYARKVDCASYSVPENYASPSDRAITIRIVRLASSSYRPSADPLVMIAGGPGASAVASFLFADTQFNKINQNRDIYLIDQRGTGGSARLECSAFTSSTVFTELNSEKIKASARQCLRELAYDPRFFTTAVAVEDLETVRKALNITRWNLYGSSYGTMVSQQYLRRYPSAIRSVILDGVLDVGKSLTREVPIESQRALEALFDRCHRDADCREGFPNLRQKVNTLLDRLQASHIPTRIENINHGRMETVDFSLAHFSTAVRLSLYNDVSLATLPSMLYEAAQHQNYAPLIRLTRQFQGSFKHMLSLPMHMSVVCTEDPLLNNSGFVASATLKNAKGRRYFDASVEKKLTAICEVWPKGITMASFNKYVTSSTPVLLLSGELDPVTPPAYAAAAMQKMRNAKHIIVPGRGHGVAAVACATTLIAQFLEELHAKALNISCFKRLKPAPFFKSLNSPAP